MNIKKKNPQAKEPPRPVRFHMTCTGKTRRGNSYTVSAEHFDPNLALKDIVAQAAHLGEDGFIPDTAKVTIIATREFIQTFKPMEDV